MDAIDHGAAQQGTFNGNPLVAAAGLATLTEVLTPDAYDAPRQARHPPRRGLPAGDGRERHPRPRGRPRRQGLRVVPPSRCGTTATSSRPNPDLYLASYPWAMNRGIFMTPGDEEQWTISVQHTEADIDRYVESFADFCAALAA